MTDPITAGQSTTLDVLAGPWRIYQLRDGHRFSADDLLTAWTAAEAKPRARTLLDLGAGIGSVGLLTLWRMGGGAQLDMVEVQPVSHSLALCSIAHNGLEGRVRAHLQDLRDWPGGRFELVTGSPPYIPPGRGTPSRHPQKAACRFELHGDVADYCAAAARSLAPNGRFVFCHAAADPRPELAIRAAGLVCLGRREVHFRAHLAPAIALYSCGREGTRRDPSPLFIRDREGGWTPEYLAIREAMGAPREFLRQAREGSAVR